MHQCDENLWWGQGLSGWIGWRRCLLRCASIKLVDLWFDNFWAGCAKLHVSQMCFVWAGSFFPQITSLLDRNILIWYFEFFLVRTVLQLSNKYLIVQMEILRLRYFLLYWFLRFVSNTVHFYHTFSLEMLREISPYLFWFPYRLPDLSQRILRLQTFEKMHLREVQMQWRGWLRRWKLYGWKWLL